MKFSEADIQRTVTEYLEWDGWYALRTDPVSRREWGKGFGKKGMADHLYMRPQYPFEIKNTDNILSASAGEVMWIEWKSKDGKAKQHQLDWRRDMKALGFLVLLAGADFPATIEGFQAWYKASGLEQRKMR